jgi:hypothetical protein
VNDMRAIDIVIGESYRHKDHPTYCWAKAIKVLKPKQDENTNSYIVVKCEWSTEKNDKFGMIKYFTPSNLVKPKA